MKSITIATVCLLSFLSAEAEQKTFGWVTDLFLASKTTRLPSSSKPTNINAKTCGLQFTRSFNEKIIGGRDASPGEYPWQVSLQLKRGTSWFHFCGGSIINNQYILTAAHCCQNLNLANFRVVMGAHNLKSFNGYEVIATASKVINHENYDSNRMKNDIALIKLSKPVDLSTASGSPINSVCLPSISPAEGELLQVSGWGRTTEGGSSADKLQVVGVALITNRECNKYYPGKIYEGMLCAGYRGGGKDACQGDSGGPIVKCKTGQACQLTGIVSWGYGCARPNNPGVYTATHNYVNWVSDKISKTRHI